MRFWDFEPLLIRAGPRLTVPHRVESLRPRLKIKRKETKRWKQVPAKLRSSDAGLCISLTSQPMLCCRHLDATRVLTVLLHFGPIVNWCYMECTASCQVRLGQQGSIAERAPGG
jgi:hypothetical protein